MTALRNTPPAEVGGVKVAQFIDHTKTDRQSDILVFNLENGGRLIARPSGTEPKIKFYIGAKANSEEAAKEKVAALQADLEKITIINEASTLTIVRGAFFLVSLECSKNCFEGQKIMV